MLRKLTSLALPFSLSMLFLGAEPSLASTPITTFGVTAMVSSGCSVSAEMLYANNATALANAESSVSVNCTNATQYIVKVNAVTAASPGMGGGTLPISSFMFYAMPSNSARNLKPAGTTGPVYGVVQPLIVYGEPIGPESAGPDTISVAITY